jgi:serine/threonine protein kinase
MFESLSPTVFTVRQSLLAVLLRILLDGRSPLSRSTNMQVFEPEISSSTRYETLARIGRGGMAEVLLAATRGSGVVKLSVLKCLWPELAEDPEFVEMFLDEARLCARLSHPNVVQTHDVVEHEGRLALVLEYLEGQPLSNVLSRLCASPALSLPARLRILTSVLAGLEYAHELTDFDGAPLQVVHRDVSPHNVIVTYDGHVKLIDFGVAKTFAASHQTHPGIVKGKLAYLAPEALRGNPVDRRADIFSVGVMLWEMLAGRRLWGGRSDGWNGAYRLAAGAPAPSLPEDVKVPRALRVITTRALAIDPAARFQTAADLAAALEDVGVDSSSAHMLRLGRLVSESFANERAQRRALIDSHLRRAGASARAADDYETIEISTDEILAGPDVTPPALPPATKTEPRRRAGPLIAAAAIACVALSAGMLAERGAIPWPSRAFSASAPSMAAPAVPASSTVVIEPTEPPAEPATDSREARAAAFRERREHRERQARRARNLDLSGDDVLGLDGEPLSVSPATARARSRRD